MRRAWCRLRGWWWTATEPMFWDSLIHPPLVVMSGHIWDYEASFCVECGYVGP